MTLSVRQKSNIRHFVYYLVNGTLDFELIQTIFDSNYYDVLKSKPDFFFKTSCVFINQEIKLNPNWPNTKRLGNFICRLHCNNLDKTYFETWEIDFTENKADYSSDFKKFTRWFIEAKTVDNIKYNNYIEDGASFVEQCFAIWANVVNIENNRVTNFSHAIERVEQYIKSYYLPGYINDLEEWEYELHME